MKKFLISLSIGLALVGCLYTHVVYNFHDYQIYYYIHSTKTDKSLLPAVIIKYLDTVVAPKRDYNGQFTYVTRGLNSISQTVSLTRSTDLWESPSGTSSKYIYVQSEEHSNNETTDYLYNLDGKLKVISISIHSENGNKKVTTITPADQQLVDEGIEKLVTSVIEDRVSSPFLVNLQWLYDLTYKSGKS